MSRHSTEFLKARTKLGWVQLDASLEKKINGILSKQKLKYTEIRDAWDEKSFSREAYGYLATRFLHSHGACTNIFSQLSNRLNFKPRTLLDFGSGPATAYLAAQKVFNQSIESATLVDHSEAMLNLAKEVTDDSTLKLFKRQLETSATSYDLVVAAFVLQDLGSEVMIKSTLEELWAKTKDVLVLVDRGNNQGSHFMHAIREKMLQITKSDAHWIVAPCPHSLKCPIEKCGFSQRIHIPSPLMALNAMKDNNLFTSFSYLVIQRGEKPLDPHVSWPRLIAPPLKRKQHVILDMCAPSGSIERTVTAKSHGKVYYADAKKAHSGDLWPHPPMTKVIVKPLQTTMTSKVE